MTRQGKNYVIVNPFSSAVGGFTLYCEVWQPAGMSRTKLLLIYQSLRALVGSKDLFPLKVVDSLLQRSQFSNQLRE